MRRAGLVLLFFVSGALGLCYEILWLRKFALVFGSAAPATAAVLAAFFAGLGLGAALMGSAAKRWSRPLRAYAVLEIGIGAGALLSVPMLRGLEHLHPWFYEHLGSRTGLFLGIKGLLAFVSIAGPAICIGGTLPVLAELVDRGERRLGTSAGLLYAANTAGAGVGVLSVSFVLLGYFGVAGTLYLCAAGNLLVAAAAWIMDRAGFGEIPGLRATRPATFSGQTRRQRGRFRSFPYRGPGGARDELGKVVSGIPGLGRAFFSGVIVFVLQVLWNRAFAQVHENSLHSFSLIAAVFIFALAAGAQASRAALRWGARPDRIIAWAWVAGGLMAAAGPWVFLSITNGLEYVVWTGDWKAIVRLGWLFALILFLPVGVLAMAYPAIMELAGRNCRRHAGDILGALLCVNVAGSVAGALLAGFVLPQWTGYWGGIFLTGSAVVAAGLCHLKPEKVAGWRFAGGILIVVFAAFWLAARHDLPRVRIDSTAGERLLDIREGRHGVVAVMELGVSRRLVLNNHYVLGGTVSTADERLQLHLPLLLHPSPRRVAALGIGTGITAGAAHFHPVERLAAVEVVPEVIQAAASYFDAANLGILADPRTTIHVEDGRNYLRNTREQFDVIVGDLIVPWQPGEAALLTLENFSAARRSLAPGGLFCQWLPLFQLSETDLRIVIRTFLAVFPEALILRGDFSGAGTAWALAGWVDSFELNPRTVHRRIEETRVDPTNRHLTVPFGFWMHVIGVITHDSFQPADGRINSEDFPWLELAGQRRHRGISGRDARSLLAQFKAPPARERTEFGWEEWKGSDAGDLLFEFSLLLFEGKETEAKAVQARLRDLLPDNLYNMIF